MKVVRGGEDYLPILDIEWIDFHKKGLGAAIERFDIGADLQPLLADLVDRGGAVGERWLGLRWGRFRGWFRLGQRRTARRNFTRANAILQS
jgi:hypothetical protein